jgi:hypothetical protein
MCYKIHWSTIVWHLLGVDTGEEREKMDASRRALISTLAMLEWREAFIDCRWRLRLRRLVVSYKKKSNTNRRTDTETSLLIFILLPAISKGLGFGL